jgi:hypothetical protein
MEQVFAARVLALQAINGGFSTPKALAALLGEFDISPVHTRKACTWLSENGFVDRVQGQPAPNAPGFIKFAWHYMPKRFAKAQERMALLLEDVKKGEGYGWDLLRDNSSD